jgi:nucleotide-binding universal stress UspA family protein
MKTILAAIDGAPSAADVLRIAGELSQSTNAQLVLFRAANVLVTETSPRVSPDENRFREQLLNETHRILEEQRAHANLKAELRVGIGPVEQLVVELGRELNADLIVIGAHGFGEREGALGVAAAHILAEADRSVLVVRPTQTT